MPGLTVTRRAGETIVCRSGQNDIITITMKQVIGCSASINVQAPRHVQLLRGELDCRESDRRPSAADPENDDRLVARLAVKLTAEMIRNKILTQACRRVIDAYGSELVSQPLDETAANRMEAMMHLIAAVDGFELDSEPTERKLRR